MTLDDKQKPMVYLQIKSDFLDSFLLSESLFDMRIYNNFFLIDALLLSLCKSLSLAFKSLTVCT